MGTGFFFGILNHNPERFGTVGRGHFLIILWVFRIESFPDFGNMRES
jgi:hypothetical protein